jgi:SMC interacting uncharacterized protein involved in chromosome segregation
MTEQDDIAKLESEIKALRKSVDELKKVQGIDLGRCQTTFR